VAQERARELGVAARAVVRHGATRKTIEDYVRQAHASALVIGAPRTPSTSPTFTHQALDDFVTELRQTTGVSVVVVH